jgi:hypothetical protein
VSTTDITALEKIAPTSIPTQEVKNIHEVYVLKKNCMFFGDFYSGLKALSYKIQARKELNLTTDAVILNTVMLSGGNLCPKRGQKETLMSW